MVTTTRPVAGSSSTARRMPSSSMVTTRISGSTTAATAALADRSPLRAPGVGAVQHLHLGQQVRQVLGVHAVAPAGRAPSRPPAGPASPRRARPTRWRRSRPAGWPGRPAPPGPPANSSWVYGQTSSTRGLHPAVRLLGAVTEPLHPQRAVVQVVRGLLARLRADRGQPLVGAPGQRGVERQLVRRQEEQLRHGRPRSRRWAARPAGSCGTPGRRAGTPARPRPGRRPPAHPRTSAAAGPRRAGRGRCWPARCPPPSPARGWSTRRAAAPRSARRRRGARVKSKQAGHRWATPSGTS